MKDISKFLLRAFLLSLIVIKLNFSQVNIGIISDWGVPCGVAEYSKHIYDALIERRIKVIKYDYKMKFPQLLDKLKKDKIKLLNIQYDPGLFPNMQALGDFLVNAKKAKIKTVCTVHEEHSGAFKLIYHLTDFCIFHQAPKFCKGKKFKIIKLPVPVFDGKNLDKDNLRKKYGFDTNDKIIVTTGFIFVPKRLPEILVSLTPAIKSDDRIKIQFLNAVTPRAYERCIKESARLQQVITQNSLSNQVIFINEFLSETELRERMFLSDVGFTWLDVMVNSISATEKEFISSRVPFVSNYNSHFDIATGVIKVQNDTDLLAQKIIELLNDQSTKDMLRLQIDKLYNTSNYRKKIIEYIDVFNLVLKAQGKSYAIV